MATDGRSLFVNPTFLNTLSDKEVRAVLVHEVMHVTDGHHLRIGKRDPQRWNIAADYAINPIVIEQCGNTLPDGALLDRQYTGMSTEQIYGALQEEENARPQSGDEGDPSNDDGTDPGACGGVLAPTNEDGTGLNPDQVEEAKRELNQRVAQAVQQAQKRGDLPGSLKELIKNARTAQVDWVERMHATVKGNAPTDYTWRRPNRKRLQDGIYMPSINKECGGEIAIGLDTSGSVSRAAFEQFAGEVLALCEETQPSAVHLLYCDTQVHPESYDQDEIDDIKIERKGGGGTSFVPVFDWIDERIANGEEPPQYVIYLTDGYGTEPDIEPDYPVLWVCCSPKEMKIGETVRINA